LERENFEQGTTAVDRSMSLMKEAGSVQEIAQT
jgi:hypothetical protein